MSTRRSRRLAMLLAGAWLMLAPLTSATGNNATASTAISNGYVGQVDPASDPFGTSTPVLVVLDTSGSMSELANPNSTENGLKLRADATRIDAAKAAVLDLIDALGESQRYGLVTYPAGASDPETGCQGAHVQTPLRPLDVATASAAVRRIRPSGETPTGPALAEARDLLTSNQVHQATIVLVSDGLSNCGPAPCDVAKQITADGYEIVVNTVGFHVEGEAVTELTCVAEETGGRFVGADSADELYAAIGAGSVGHLQVDVEPPAKLVVTSGDTDSENNSFKITIGSDGQYPANDVRASLTLTQKGSAASGVLIPRPVRFLGNLASGATQEITIATRPREKVDQIDWKVVVTAKNALGVPLSGQVGVADLVTTNDLGGVLNGVQRVAVLGDSYSSGEGTEEYNDPQGMEGCHQSAHQYANVLWGEDNVDLLACSGATTSDIYGTQEVRSTKKRVPPQLGRLRRKALSKTPPDAVLLTIGGNDAGFGAIATECLFYGACNAVGNFFTEGAWPLTQMLDYALAVEPDINRVLGAVDSAVNDPVARERRGGDTAPIIILTYPQIIPEADAARGGCMTGISTDEIRDLNKFLSTLNASVSNAAYTLRGKGRPVYVVPQVASAFLPNHTICDEGSSYATYSRAQKLPDLHFHQQELLHPNKDGYQAMARALVEWSNTKAAARDPRELKGSVRWEPTFTSPSALDQRTEQLATDLERVDDFTSLHNKLYLATHPWAPLWAVLDIEEPSAPVSLEAEGFGSGSDVVLRFESTPTSLGVVTADAEGKINTTVNVPAWAEPGTHHIHMVGFDAKGRSISKAVPLKVVARGTGQWLLFGVLGSLALGISILALVRRHRGRPRTRR